MRKRSGRPQRFAAVPNETIDDAANLDFMALALLTVLIRHRDGWEITLSEIGEKYGYGRDALANAIGLLQAARYVVKVRMMAVERNEWSTEVYIFDTPATDGEVAALIAEIERAPEVRRASVIEPTESATAHAGRRREKLQRKRRQGPSVAVPRVPENPYSDATSGNEASSQVDPECRDSRQSGNPAASKKTVGENTREKTDAPSARSALDAGGQTSGSGGREQGGFAASGKSSPGSADTESASGQRPEAPKGPGHSRRQLEQARAVCALFPSELGVRLVPVLTDAILGALAGDVPGAGRTTGQLGARIEQRWHQHGYAEKFRASELTSPVGAAVAMVRPLASGDRYGCANPRCEAGADVDTGEPCPACPERLSDRRGARRKDDPPAGVPAPRPAAPTCSGYRECSCGNPLIASRADGLCGECRAHPGAGTGQLTAHVMTSPL